MLSELDLYNDIVDKIKDLQDVESVLAGVDGATLSHFMLRELNLLRDDQGLADREAHLGSHVRVEQAVTIATVQMLQSVIESRSDPSTVVQEALQSLARNRLADIASARTSTEWLLP